MKTIWLLEGRVDYEGSDVLGAYAKESDARAKRAELEAYGKYPCGCPAMDAPDSEWLAFHEKCKKHRDNHPLGKDATSYDDYFVYEIKIQ